MPTLIIIIHTFYFSICSWHFYSMFFVDLVSSSKDKHFFIRIILHFLELFLNNKLEKPVHKPSPDKNNNK